MVSREALADAVWGDARPVSWRAAQRNVVTELRRALGVSGLDAGVRSAGAGYVLVLPPGSTVDLIRLRALAAEAEGAVRQDDLRLARELTGRELLDAPRVILPGGQEEWVEGLRAEVEGLRQRLAFTAAQAALALGDPAGAERLARGLVQEARLREDFHRVLISALRAAGRRAEALLAYDACRRVLADELGAMPARPTQELFLEILAEEREEHPQPTSRSGGAVAAGRLLLIGERTAFVGRNEILGHLAERLALVRSAGGLITCLSGEPGIGKTRLAAELATTAHQAGMSVLYGRADDRITIPFAAWLGALEVGLAGMDAGELAVALGEHAALLSALVPSLGPARPANLRPVEVQSQRVRPAILAALRLLAGSTGGLLVLDDMQWASRADAEVLEGLLADPEPIGLLVLVLHRRRDDRGGLDNVGEHPRLERLALGPLTVANVAQLMQLHGTEDVHGLAERVWRRSGGNALLASELLRASPAPDGHDHPVRVDELVRARLALLPGEVEGVLRVAAVAGIEFDSQLVSAASPLPARTVNESLAAARNAGLLVAADDAPGRLAFRHGLVHESLLDGLDPAERSRVHSQLGSLLQSDSRSDPAALVRLAYHHGAAGAGGNWREAVRYGLPAARLAQQAGVYEDVIATATRTLTVLSAANDPDPDARLDLEVLLGGAQRALGDPAGHSTLRRAFEQAARRGDPTRMADAALAFSEAGALSEGLFVDDSVRSLYQRALSAVDPDDRDHRARLLGRLANGFAWRQSAAAGRAVSEQAIVLAREVGDQRTLAMVLAAVRRSLIGWGDPGEQARLEDELLKLAEQNEDEALRVSALLWRFDSEIMRGRGHGLEALVAEAAERARPLRIGIHHHSLALAQAALALLRGRLDEAELLVDRAAAIGRARGLDSSLVEAIRLTQMMLVRGEQHRLGELHDEAEPVFAGSPVSTWVGALAVMDAARGHLHGVGERIDAVLDDYVREGPTILCPGGVIAFYAATAVKLGDRDRIDRIHELIVPLSGQGTYHAGFAGPIDYHLGLLDRAAGRDEDADRRLTDALEFCRRLDAPRWQQRCQTALIAG
ncbi:MAG TPA: AAA family ATPase [Solirubrobacteraceae bacterium]|nr:AAA family ATPase [Solirubrobacteraceae bacterium]